MSNTRKASRYSTQEFTADVEGHELRFIVVKTSEGKGRAVREVLKQRKLFEEGITALGKKTFVCEVDAEEEWLRFQKEFRKNLHLPHKELKKTETIKRPRGNPGKDPLPPVIETTWKVSVTIEGLDADRFKQYISHIPVFGIDTASTTVEIAKLMAPFTKIAVTGGSGQDALSLASIAGSEGLPILYTGMNGIVPTSVSNYIKDLQNITTSYIIGGSAVVPSSITFMLPGGVMRYAGTTFYDTNLEVLRGFNLDLNYDHVFIANGETIVEALAGASLAARFKAPIVLTNGSTVASSYIASKIGPNCIVTAFGGTEVVPESVVNQIGAANTLL